VQAKLALIITQIYPCPSICLSVRDSIWPVNNQQLPRVYVWDIAILGGLVAQWLGRWLVIERSRVRLTACPLPSNNSGQVVHTHVPL